MKKPTVFTLCMACLIFGCASADQPVTSEETIPAGRAPADAAAQDYIPDKALEKKIDKKLRLHARWTLDSIEGKRIHVHKEQQRPRLEINMEKMGIAGNDGCNDFMGRIAIAGSETLAFGRIAVTMKDCFDMDIPDSFHRHINNTRSYAIQGPRLYLFDSQGNELFGFRKTD